MVYVALLRGINVGGKNKVNMKDLKETFLRAGMHSATTYINSGNIIFIDDKHSKQKLSSILEKVIMEDFGLAVKVLIRSLDDIKALMKVLPKTWTNDDRMKSDVLFLWDEADQKDLSTQVGSRPEIDSVVFTKGTILWSVARKDGTKSGLLKIVGTPLYKQLTIRNVNTTRKIYEIMQDMDQKPD